MEELRELDTSPGFSPPLGPIGLRRALRPRASKHTIVVQVRNAYSDGYESVQHYALPALVNTDGLEDRLYELTGDGHGIGRGDLGSCYTAVVITGPFVGTEYEWID